MVKTRTNVESSSKWSRLNLINDLCYHKLTRFLEIAQLVALYEMEINNVRGNIEEKAF